MKRNFFLLAMLAVFIFGGTQYVYAQDKPNAGKAKFYEPMTHKKLFTQLPPRLKSRFSEDSAGFLATGSGGCPDEINIGSIVEDNPIYGGVDNEVFIDGDIVIKCD